jgi:hypothetical protein
MIAGTCWQTCKIDPDTVTLVDLCPGHLEKQGLNWAPLDMQLPIFFNIFLE